MDCAKQSKIEKLFSEKIIFLPINHYLNKAHSMSVYEYLGKDDRFNILLNDGVSRYSYHYHEENARRL